MSDKIDSILKELQKALDEEHCGNATYTREAGDFKWIFFIKKDLK